MTAQFGDIYQYQSKDYTIVGLSSGSPFDPRAFDLEPNSVCSACWRGYWCDYSIIDDELVLKDLYIHNDDDKYPPLNGVEVSPPEFEEHECYTRKKKREMVTIPAHFGHRVYRDVGLPIPYTGKILLGAGFLWEYHIHGGFQRGWAYKELIELIFEEGLLLDYHDLSHIAEAQREAIKMRDQDPQHSSQILKEIEDRFLADYRDEAWWWT